MKKNRFTNVVELVRSLSEDGSLADELAVRLARRKLVKLLAVLRTQTGLSQQELAEKLGCTQSKVSKLESSDDLDLRLEDVVDYAHAVDHELCVFLVPKGRSLADDVRMHATLFRHLLERLADHAGEHGASERVREPFVAEVVRTETERREAAKTA